MIKIWIIGIVLGLVFLLMARYVLHFREWVNSDVGYTWVKGKFPRALYLFVFIIFCIPCVGVIANGVALACLIVSLCMGDVAFKVKTNNKTLQKLADYLAEEV